MYKVILEGDGTAEIAYTVPSVRSHAWATNRGVASRSRAEPITKDDEAIYRKLFADKNPRESERCAGIAFI